MLASGWRSATRSNACAGPRGSRRENAPPIGQPSQQRNPVLPVRAAMQAVEDLGLERHQADVRVRAHAEDSRDERGFGLRQKSIGRPFLRVWHRQSGQYSRSAMQLPGRENAVIDRAKLTEYCLDRNHPRGKHKARVFSSALGINAENAELLRVALLNAAATGNAEPVASDRFGQRYVIDFRMNGPRGSGIVRSIWILRTGENAPRLTSCYVT
jgi:hypothetical protein